MQQACASSSPLPARIRIEVSLALVAAPKQVSTSKRGIRMGLERRLLTVVSWSRPGSMWRIAAEEQSTPLI
jgi:hypothetical protein